MQVIKTFTTKIEKETLFKCIQFADKSYETRIDKYKNRNQTNAKKIKKQILCGAISEFGASDFIKKVVKIDVSSPDLSIYKSNKKTYSADLKTRQHKIHVKSFWDSIYGKESWIFQNGKEKDCDSIFTNKNKRDDLIIFSQVMGTISFGIKVRIYALMKIKTLFEKDLFKEPYSKKMIGIKKAIYLMDLIKLGEHERWLPSLRYWRL